MIRCEFKNKGKIIATERLPAPPGVLTTVFFLDDVDRPYTVLAVSWNLEIEGALVTVIEGER
jgi:hypothetical protein